jgi:nicotinamide mononucleotide transporter
MVYQKYETWILWLVVDLGYTALYFSQELHLTSMLYLVFTVVAAVGWRSWYATYRRTG